MAERKSEAADSQVGEKAGELAKSIWLAGLGAYGRAIDQAHEQYEKASKETTRLFEDLVAKGQKLEGNTQDKLKTVKSKSNLNIEERINKVRESLGFVDSCKGSTLGELNSKVDKLSKKLDLVINAITKQGQSKGNNK